MKLGYVFVVVDGKCRCERCYKKNKNKPRKMATPVVFRRRRGSPTALVNSLMPSFQHVPRHTRSIRLVFIHDSTSLPRGRRWFAVNRILRSRWVEPRASRDGVYVRSPKADKFTKEETTDYDDYTSSSRRSRASPTVPPTAVDVEPPDDR